LGHQLVQTVDSRSIDRAQNLQCPQTIVDNPGHAEKNLSLIINDLRRILEIFFSRRRSFSRLR
jgi:hypothetical protein